MNLTRLFAIVVPLIVLSTVPTSAQIERPTVITGPVKIAGQDEDRKSVSAKTGYEIQRFRSETYTTYESDKKKLSCDVYVPLGKGPFPAILMIHGGAWKSGTKFQMKGHAEAAAKKGFVTVSINYRHAPEYKWPAQNEDCRRAISWMVDNASKYKIDSGRLSIWGYSAGGHLATFLATQKGSKHRSSIKCVVCGGGPVDLTLFPKDLPFLTYFIGATPRQAPEKYRQASPITHLSSNAPPMFFYHGEKDVVVPVEGVKNMVSKARKLGVTCEFMLVPNKEHILTFFDQESFDKALEFIAKKTSPDQK